MFLRYLHFIWAVVDISRYFTFFKSFQWLNIVIIYWLVVFHLVYLDVDFVLAILWIYLSIVHKISGIGALHSLVHEFRWAYGASEICKLCQLLQIILGALSSWSILWIRGTRAVYPEKLARTPQWPWSLLIPTLRGSHVALGAISVKQLWLDPIEELVLLVSLLWPCSAFIECLHLLLVTLHYFFDLWTALSSWSIWFI